MEQGIQVGEVFNRILSNCQEAVSRYNQAEAKGFFDRASLLIVRDSFAAMADLTQLVLLEAEKNKEP